MPEKIGTDEIKVGVLSSDGQLHSLLLSLLSSDNDTVYNVIGFNDLDSIKDHFSKEGLDFLVADFREKMEAQIELVGLIAKENPMVTCIGLVDSFDRGNLQVAASGVHEIITALNITETEIVWRLQVARKWHNRMFSMINDNDIYCKMLEYSNDIMVILSPEGYILYTSPNVKHILGCDSQEYIGKSAIEFIHPNDAEQKLKLFEQLLGMDEDEPMHSEMRLINSKREFVAVDVTARNMMNYPNIKGVIVNYRRRSV